jgi:peptidyl-prolyl cis-trans isomerase C
VSTGYPGRAVRPVRPRPLGLVRALAALAALALTTTVAHRIEAGPVVDGRAAERAAVVARVGPHAISAGELEDRLATIPALQRASFGGDPQTIKKRFLEEVLVPEVLLALGAESRHIERDLPVSQSLARVRSNATMRALREEVGASQAIPNEAILKYYGENKARYEAPERYSIWRILCQTREEAVAVLEAAKKDPTIPNFQALARDHSIDKATSLRGGNLGFVSLDGVSNEAGLKVDPTTVKAATTVKDGELVPAPVGEGASFAVVWRRGTVGASRRTLEEVSAQIRDTLHKQKLENAEKKLLEDLRKRELKELNEPLLALIEISPNDGAITPRRRPGQVPPINAPTK